MRVAITGVWLLLTGLLACQCGCAVPQQPGKGMARHRTEPETRTGYWLYLPEDYVKRSGRHPSRQRWPTVVTFHGMNPYDTATAQIREWQEEADRYGLIVIAPELRTCTSLMQYPLRDPNLWYVRQDERATLLVMGEVFRQTNADPNLVLATSFSSGGYLAHFLVNRYPERFSCLAVRGSNFSSDLLATSQIPKYRDMPIGIFFGENDFKPCRDESEQAVEWYRSHRFPLEAKRVGGLGHERHPQIAAALFARVTGLTPKTPPDLGGLVMIDIPTNGPQFASKQALDRYQPVASPLQSTAEPGRGTFPDGGTGEGNLLFAESPTGAQPATGTPTQVAPGSPSARPISPIVSVPRPQPTPKRPTQQPYNTGIEPAPRTDPRPAPATIPPRERASAAPIPATIRTHGETTGHAPLWVNLSLELPAFLREGSSVLWTSNNIPIASNEYEVQTVLREPGEHQIVAFIVTADDREVTAEQTIRVLASTSQPSGS